MNGQFPKDRELQQRLNSLLHDMELETPSSVMADRVMRIVQHPETAAVFSKQQSFVQPKRRPEFLHICVASAATYFFIQSGVLQGVSALPESVNKLSSLIEWLSSIIGI